MNLRSKRRLAADVLGVGEDRIIFDEEYTDLIQDAITRSTIRGLVGFGAIRVAPEKGISRGRLRAERKQPKRGRGPGSYKGSRTARVARKERWVTKVRSLRMRLRVARERKQISTQAYWRLYQQVKGGQVRGVKHLLELLKEAKG